MTKLGSINWIERIRDNVVREIVKETEAGRQPISYFILSNRLW